MIAGSAPVRLGSSDQEIEHPRKPIMVVHCIHTVAYLPGEDVLGDRQRLLAVALLETVDAPARIHDLVLTGVERMRLARNFDLDQRIFLAIFPLDGFAGLDGRSGLERKIAGQVLKNDFAVIWMNFCLHGVEPALEKG